MPVNGVDRGRVHAVRLAERGKCDLGDVGCIVVQVGGAVITGRGRLNELTKQRLVVRGAWQTR